MVDTGISEDYRKAFFEVSQILEYLDSNDYKKVPKEVIDVIENNKEETDFKYNPNKTFEEQNVSKLAIAIVAILFENCWATPEQKAKIEEFYKKQEAKEEEKKKEQYSTDVFGEANSNSQNINNVNIQNNMNNTQSNQAQNINNIQQTQNNINNVQPNLNNINSNAQFNNQQNNGQNTYIQQQAVNNYQGYYNQNSNVSTAMIVKPKENWFKKMINKIKNIFKK